MKKLSFFFLFMLLAGPVLAAEAFTLKSPQIKEGGALNHAQVFNGFGCSGGNISPALEWSNPPAGTKSFALTVYDPDAPTGSGWWHWVVFNIPASARSIPLNASAEPAQLPAGAVQSITDFGAPGYGGACPPEGDKPHRYIFTLYALSTPALELEPCAMPALVGFNIHGVVLGKAVLTATYAR